jgi:hypothetical protein
LPVNVSGGVPVACAVGAPAKLSAAAPHAAAIAEISDFEKRKDLLQYLGKLEGVNRTNGCQLGLARQMTVKVNVAHTRS